MNQKPLSARERQAPLRRAYVEDPALAITTKRVVSLPTPDADLWHGRITAPDFAYTTWNYGIDAQVGGDGDRPNPGHLLCAALAACLESTTRVMADHFAVRLEELVVEVVGEVDVRGCLAVDRGVRPGFRHIDAKIRLRPAPGTDSARVQHLLDQAEALCATLDTVRHGVQVDVTTAVEHCSADGEISAGASEVPTAR